MEVARNARALFVGDFIRVYVTNDVVGVELGGALKNIFAIAAGIDTSALVVSVLTA